MSFFDYLLLGAAAYMLWRGYIFLLDKDRAWQLYVERQQRLNRDSESLERDENWERVANIQGVVFTALGIVGTVAAFV